MDLSINRVYHEVGYLNALTQIDRGPYYKHLPYLAAPPLVYRPAYQDSTELHQFILAGFI